MTKLLCVILLFLPFTSKSDDGYLGSRGGNVFPIIRNEQIRMMQEEIKINMFQDSCNVNCKFWFTNESMDTISYVLVGFPDYFNDPGTASMGLRNFTCKVNGKETKVDKYMQTSIAYTDSSLRVDTLYDEYQYWYCWTIEYILPHQTLFIENFYTGDYGGSISGNSTFSYLIGTAQTWKSTIAKGRIIFDYSHIASKLFLDTSDYYSENLPNGIIRTVFDDSTVFSFKDYYPKWNEMIELSIYPYWESPNGNLSDTATTYPFAYDDNPINKFDKTRLHLMRNEIYARHGYTFKDKFLKNYFENKTWYKADSEFTVDKLNRYETLMVNYLRELEKK